MGTMKYFVAAVMLLHICGSSAWFNPGHITVAAIAYNHMSLRAQARANDILRELGTDGSFAAGEQFLNQAKSRKDRHLLRFLYASTFADDIKEDTTVKHDGAPRAFTTTPAFPLEPISARRSVKDTWEEGFKIGKHRESNHIFDSWHFDERLYPYTSGVTESGVPAQLSENNSNLSDALFLIWACIRDLNKCPKIFDREGEKAPEISQSIMLRLFIHLIGDLFMPLHTVSREFTCKNSRGREVSMVDRGGNLVQTMHNDKKKGIVVQSRMMKRDGSISERNTFSMPNLHMLMDSTAGLLPNTPYDHMRSSRAQVTELLEIVDKTPQWRRTDDFKPEKGELVDAIDVAKILAISHTEQIYKHLHIQTAVIDDRCNVFASPAIPPEKLPTEFSSSQEREEAMAKAKKKLQNSLMVVSETSITSAGKWLARLLNNLLDDGNPAAPEPPAEADIPAPEKAFPDRDGDGKHEDRVKLPAKNPAKVRDQVQDADAIVVGEVVKHAKKKTPPVNPAKKEGPEQVVEEPMDSADVTSALQAIAKQLKDEEIEKRNRMEGPAGDRDAGHAKKEVVADDADAHAKDLLRKQMGDHMPRRPSEEDPRVSEDPRAERFKMRREENEPVPPPSYIDDDLPTPAISSDDESNVHHIPPPPVAPRVAAPRLQDAHPRPSLQDAVADAHDRMMKRMHKKKIPPVKFPAGDKHDNTGATEYKELKDLPPIYPAGDEEQNALRDAPRRRMRRRP